MLGLLGILEAGRGIAAPPAIGGEWTVEFDGAGRCASGPAGLRQPALNISQSGTEARITLNDGHASTLDAAISGVTLRSKSLIATISGQAGARTLEGQMLFADCAPVPFRAVRQAARKGAE